MNWKLSMKRTGVAYLVWLLLGLIGGHRYYLGRWRTGLLMTVTIGGAGIWWLIDAFLLPGMVRQANGAEVNPRVPSSVPEAAIEEVDVSLIVDLNGEPVSWSATGFIREMPDGTIRLRVASEGEAKLAMEDLTLFRKKIAIERQEVAQAMASQRAARQLQVARQGPTMRGGGGFGRFVRSLDAMNRSFARSAHANQLAPLQVQKEQYDRALLELDTLINQLKTERLRLRTAKAEGWE